MRVLAAQLSGTAAAHAHVRRISRDEALAEIAETLIAAKIRPDSERAVAVFTDAATMYVQPTQPGADRWYPIAAELLKAAGADLARAVELRRQRGAGVSFQP